MTSHIFTIQMPSDFPLMESDLTDNYRGQPIFNIGLCIGCGLCSLNCPAKALELVEVGGKRYPQLSLDKCIFCYLCVDCCPKKAIMGSSIFELATIDKSSLEIKPEQTFQEDKTR